MPTIYDRLGVRPIINACGPNTRLGGAIMAEPVVQAMVEARRTHTPDSRAESAFSDMARMASPQGETYVTRLAASTSQHLTGEWLILSYF